MKCYYHGDRDSVMSCRRCRREFCAECADESIDGLCVACQQKEYKEAQEKITNDELKKRKEKRRRIVYAFLVAVAIVLFILYMSEFDLKNVVTPLTLASFPFGWIYLQRLSPRGSINEKKGVVVYEEVSLTWIMVVYILKFMIASMIGPVMTIFSFFYFIKLTIDIAKLKKQ